MCPATADHRPWLNRTIREAKSLQQTLKDSLKTKDPWDKETDFTYPAVLDTDDMEIKNF